MALAGALIHEPKLIILDEPLTGLDASSAWQVKAVLRNLVAQGVTVIMTMHILEVADRVGLRMTIKPTPTCSTTFHNHRHIASSGDRIILVSAIKIGFETRAFRRMQVSLRRLLWLPSALMR